MIKELVHDEEFLAKPSQPATAEDAQIAQDLVDTLESIKDECAGLAANMIGELKDIIVFYDAERPVVMYNPKIKWFSSPYTAEEGCMSLERETTVKRFKRIKVAYQVLEDGVLVDKERSYRDWIAEVIQHEIDHCKGILVLVCSGARRLQPEGRGCRALSCFELCL